MHCTCTHNTINKRTHIYSHHRRTRCIASKWKCGEMEKSNVLIMWVTCTLQTNTRNEPREEKEKDEKNKKKIIECTKIRVRWRASHRTVTHNRKIFVYVPTGGLFKHCHCAERKSTQVNIRECICKCCSFVHVCVCACVPVQIGKFSAMIQRIDRIPHSVCMYCKWRMTCTHANSKWKWTLNIHTRLRLRIFMNWTGRGDQQQ